MGRDQDDITARVKWHRAGLRVETFWEELDAKCAALGWTRSTASRAAGLDPDYLGTLWRQKGGPGVPTPLRLRLIAAAVGANYLDWLHLLCTIPGDWPNEEARSAGAAMLIAEPSEPPEQPPSGLPSPEQLRLWGAESADPGSVAVPSSDAMQGGPDFPGPETGLNSANSFAGPGLLRVSPLSRRQRFPAWRRR
jgi:hypothetical protein